MKTQPNFLSMLKQTKKRSIFANVNLLKEFYSTLLPKVIMIESENTPQDRDGLPPFVKNWPQLYAMLIGTLVLLIVLFYLFMTHFQ